MMITSNITLKKLGILIASILFVIVLIVGIDARLLTGELNSVNSSWLKFNAERSIRYRMLRPLNAVLGYGGMIHHFKNYLLRKDIVNLRKSEQFLATAHFIISSYRGIADNEEQLALNDIEEMLNHYTESLIVINKLINADATIKQIDKQIKVDDQKAIAALLILQHKSSTSAVNSIEDILSRSKLKLVNKLRSRLGYNGMIHHFKNYILRGEKKYRNLADNDFIQLDKTLAQYKALNLNNIEQAALLQLHKTIDQYKMNIELAGQMMAMSKTIVQIEQKVAINDQPAFNAFQQLNREINLQNESEAKRVTDTLYDLEQGVQQRSILIIILLLFSLITIMWMLISKVIRPITSITTTMQLLAENKLDTPIDTDMGNNEIGIMTRTLDVFKNNALKTLKDAQLIQKIMDSAGEGIYGINTQGRVTFINPKAAHLLGWEPKQLLGQDIHAYCHYKKADGSDYLVHDCPTRIAMTQSQTIHSDEELFWHKNGGSFPVEMNSTPLFEKGDVSGAVVLFQDISERKRVESLKTEFISTVSHELRTPLTSIRGSLGLVTGGAVGELPQKAEELLRIASNNTERLLILINDILDIEKIEAGSMNFQFEELQLKPLIEQVLQDNAAYAEQHEVKFILLKADETACVLADKGRLMQVMANLLSNAAKFSSAQTQVEISIVHRTQSNLVRISVTDRGPGIPETFQPKLFDKFTQSDSSDTRQKGGTGLGLSISKAIIEKHQGQIGFVSRENFGTTFYIDLPVIQHLQEPAQERLEQKEVVRTPVQVIEAQGSDILIIEDNADISTLLKIMLTEGGYNCDIASSAKQARQYLFGNKGKYKAITLDLALPDENGLNLLEELRQNVATQNIPVVVVSATADEVKRKLNGGAVSMADWLNKPIDEPRLMKAVRQAVVSGNIPRVLHVEDDNDVHTVVSHMLQEHCELSHTTTLADSQQILKAQDFDLVLLDIGLPDGSGLDLLETIEQCTPPPKVVIFSANDVSQEHADKVSAVLMKSKADNIALFEAIRCIIEKPPANKNELS